MKNNYQINDHVLVISSDFTEKYNISGKKVRIASINVDGYDYKVELEDTSMELLNDDELVSLSGTNKTLNDNFLIINSPTFNLEELQLGSLIYISKQYLQLQGFIAAITPKVLTIAYYDDHSDCYQCSHETVNIKDVVSGKYTIELIRKAISLELQGGI